MAMLGYFQIAQSTYYLHKDGSIDEGLWHAELQRLAAHLTLFPGPRQLWTAGLRTQLAPEFVEVAEAAEFSGDGVIWKERKGFVPLESADEAASWMLSGPDPHRKSTQRQRALQASP